MLVFHCLFKCSGTEEKKLFFSITESTSDDDEFVETIVKQQGTASEPCLLCSLVLVQN